MISQEENKENIIQNSLNKNYPLKNIKTKNKKITSNKFEEKQEKKKKENRHRKKLALLGFNKPNSTRNPQLLNLNLSENNFNFQNNQDNISYVGEYLEEIYMNLLLEENQSTIKPKYGYMANQPEINEIMRAILIDWIIDVHLRFNLRQDTLFMTIWLIDTYLSFAFIQRDKLQLLGITCLLISGKSHEIYYPQHNKLLEMTDNAYIKEEMLTMENEILKKLNFFIVCPNPIDFYNILSKMFNFEKKQYYLGNYFIEAALVNYPILKYSSSVIASSCAYLVMKYYKIDGYQILYNNFIVNEKCPEDVIKDAAKEIYFLVDNLSKSKFKSVKKKFSLTQFENVSEILQNLASYLNNSDKDVFENFF